MVHWTELSFIITEIIVIFLYAFCTEYGEGVHPAATSTLETIPTDSSGIVKKMLEKDRV